MDSFVPKANKNLGQHYLINQQAIEAICSPPANDCHIVEIGPGPGTLTKHLVNLENNFQVIEKDFRFKENLLELLNEDQILFQDGLKFDYSSLPEKTWIVSNLPYNISVPLTRAFADHQQIKWMSLMYQKEVAEKFLPPIGKKNSSSSLSCLFQTYFKINKLLTLSPGSFAPPPKVDSMVICFERIENPVLKHEDFSAFEKFLRQLFQFKRKQIAKVLKGFSEIDVSALLASQQIAENQRAEGLNLQQIQNLFEAWRV